MHLAVQPVLGAHVGEERVVDQPVQSPVVAGDVGAVLERRAGEVDERQGRAVPVVQDHLQARHAAGALRASRPLRREP